jgi:PAS domain S-box-containing protein
VPARGIELRGHAEQLRLLVDSVLDYAIFVLDPDGCVATWNPGAARIKGYTHGEIIGHHFRRFYTVEDRERRHPEEELVIAARDGRFEEEGWRVRKDGSRFWANVVITALRGSDGELLGYGKVTRDLTTRRAAERKLQSAQERLRESNAELSRFAAVAAHDLNGPLVSVHSLVEVLRLREGERLSEGANELLDEITGAVNRMHALIEDLLTYASFEQPASLLSAVNLSASLKPVLADLRGVIAERGVEVVVEVPDDAEVLGEATGIAVLLQNLVSNAVKFAAAQSPRVTIDARATGAGWRLTVADNGEGINPADQERIFDPFQRLRSAQRLPGTGLGLAICSRVVERAGGTLGLDSAPGKGSRFWFSLGAPAATGER